jgi:uncharacterized membrane protein YfcA
MDSNPEFGKETGMEYIFLLLLFVIAFLYSSVGHGGASGYLALMALFGISPALMRSSSLTLNVFVSAIALFAFARAGYFKIRQALPFIILSVPMAFMGASLLIKPDTYEIILAIFLLFAVARIVFVPGAVSEKTVPVRLPVALLAGAFLGFFSGMIGIGGGIILSPLLILFHWATVKEAAAISAFFILLNSLSGLTALFMKDFSYEPRMLTWVLAGIIGGIAGSWAGSRQLRTGVLKYMLAVILVMASLKLFLF